MANQLDLFADSCLKAIHNESLFRSARSNHLANLRTSRGCYCAEVKKNNEDHSSE
jgi:hypothetical protein